ncbi:hypothetical protein [Chryseobacterium shigense]|uniref:Putative tellurium resistance membrane protein TerC n=1 Tax=Chryseobacterium shigense TaxID=297244 RepID=A0A841N821_9FLAO|nr:hypothetical protein [Chryseobacterium shigense]MBB6369668.1 putative tellurium resistance membrane protein TerC [Chryseobacterium shigense]
MKKVIGIILIVIGACLAFIMKMGPAEETVWMFTYGIWPVIIAALILLITGLSLYNRNR